jgi:TRAP-type C4-dicarboxylate transport system substrate-binding protein
MLGARAGQPFATDTAPLTLRIADSLPHGHVLHRLITRPFIDDVERLSGRRIRFQHFPGEQLGKARDLLELTTGGLADVGYVVPAYHSDRMPLTAAVELPGMFSDYCQASGALWDLTHDEGYLARNEFMPNGVTALVTFLLPPYQILLSIPRPIMSVADLSGLKVRSAGGAMDFLPRHLGMVPVRMTPPEIYQGLSRGTIDGAILPYQSALSYKLGAVLRQGTVDATFGTIVLTYSIGNRRWHQLPDSTREVLLEAGRRTSLSACDRLRRAEEESLGEIRREGVQPIAWRAGDDPGLADVFTRVQREWAAGLDHRARPGSVTLAAVKRALGQGEAGRHP